MVSRAVAGATSVSAKFVITMYNMPSNGAARRAQNFPRGESSVTFLPPSSTHLGKKTQNFWVGCRVDLTEAQGGGL